MGKEMRIPLIHTAFQPPDKTVIYTLKYIH